MSAQEALPAPAGAITFDAGVNVAFLGATDAHHRAAVSVLQEAIEVGAERAATLDRRPAVAAATEGFAVVGG